MPVPAELMHALWGLRIPGFSWSVEDCPELENYFTVNLSTTDDENRHSSISVPSSTSAEVVLAIVITAALAIIMDRNETEMMEVSNCMVMKKVATI